MSIWILAKVGENERLNKIKEVGIFSKSEILNFYSPLENGKKVGVILMDASAQKTVCLCLGIESSCDETSLALVRDGKPDFIQLAEVLNGKAASCA